MPELTTTVTITGTRFDDDSLTTIVARSVLEAALAEGEAGAELWVDVERDDDETSRLAVELSPADLDEILRLSAGDDVALTFDGEYVSGLFDDPEVEAHGVVDSVTIAVASAAAGSRVVEAAPGGLRIVGSTLVIR